MPANSSPSAPRRLPRSAVEKRTSVTYHLPGMLALGVDTSEPLGGVALYDGEGLSDERLMDQPLQHAERLIPLIEEILRRNNLSRDKIGAVCVNRGPGSFTGLRIGLATAKGFCQAVGAALIAIDGVDAYRAQVGEAKRTCVIVASRRDLNYVQFFAGSRPKGPMSLVHRPELLSQLRDEEREIILVGSGAPAIGEELRGHPMIRIAPRDANRPSPLGIAKLGWSEQPVGRLYEAEPLYVEPLLS